MGKYLMIKGADFSKVAVGSTTPSGGGSDIEKTLVHGYSLGKVWVHTDEAETSAYMMVVNAGDVVKVTGNSYEGTPGLIMFISDEPSSITSGKAINFANGTDDRIKLTANVENTYNVTEKCYLHVLLTCPVYDQLNWTPAKLTINGVNVDLTY